MAGQNIDERPQTVTIQSPVEVRITNEMLPFLQSLVDPQNNPVAAAGSSGGSVLAEGRVLLWDGSSDVRWQVASVDGEAKVYLMGDDSGTPEGVALNSDHQLQVELVEGPKRVIDAAAVPNGIADVWVLGGANTEYVDLEFEVVNIDGAADVDVDVGVDLADGGGVDYYFMFQETVPAGGSVRKGPFRIGADDAVMANASAANDAVIHFYITGEGSAV